jgi:hypothetical protein
VAQSRLTITAGARITEGDGKFFVSTDWNLQGFTSFVLYATKELTSDGNFEGGLKIGYEGNGGEWKLPRSLATSPTRRTSRA